MMYLSIKLLQNLMKSLVQKVINLSFNRLGLPFSRIGFERVDDYFIRHLHKVSRNWMFSMFLGIFSSLFLYDKIKCIQKKQQSKASKNSFDFDVEIYQLNKSQFIELINNIKEENIVVVFNKYFRNQNEKQFAQHLESLYLKSKDLKIGKIYLIEKNDIKHLEIFRKWLKDQNKQNIDSSDQVIDVSSKLDYFFLTPDFKSNPFKLQKKEITDQINQIRTYYIKINPTNLNQQIFWPYQNLFNRTTLVKQCPDYVSSLSQNQCIEDYRNKIATLIQQKMLKNKADQFRFYALTPYSKKDNSSLLSFHNILNELKQAKQTSNNLQKRPYNINEDQKIENIYVLRNDIIGKSIQNMKSFKQKNYSALRGLKSYDKFLLLIKPRIFIVSKGNSSIDLYWYVTCLQKNNQPSISINNTDSFNMGKKYPITNGLSYPQNADIEFLKLLYQKHPELNYVIVNTELVSQLIRHLPVKRRYTIFNLTSDLIYPKMFLPYYNYQMSPLQNYIQFKPAIQKYVRHPAVYDQVILDKEKKINKKELQLKINDSNTNFLLRVCTLNCQQDLSSAKLIKASQNLKDIQSKNPEDKIRRSEQNQTQPTGDLSKKQKNEIFKLTYWIDSFYNNVGLQDGDYIFKNGRFQQL